MDIVELLRTKATAPSSPSNTDIEAANRFVSLLERRRHLKEVHQDVERFRAFIENQDAARFRTLVRAQDQPGYFYRRIAKIVERRMGKASIKKEVREGTDARDEIIRKYLSLIDAHQIDYGRLFNAPSPTLADFCGLQDILLKYGNQDIQTLVSNAMAERIASLHHRWFRLTGVETTTESTRKHGQSLQGHDALLTLHMKDLSTVRMEDLLALKAPVPYRPLWTEQLAQREHNRLQRLPSSSGSTNNSGTTHYIEGEDLVRETEEEASEPTKNYTFPGEFVSIQEEIFFDYSVILPVNDCTLGASVPKYFDRELVGVRIAARHANAILKDPRLGIAFKEIQAEIRPVLDQVVGFLTIADVAPNMVRDLRRQLRQVAAGIRLLGQIQLETNTAIQGPDASAIKTAVENLDIAEKDAGILIQFNERQLASKDEQVFADVIEAPATIFPVVKGPAINLTSNPYWCWPMPEPLSASGNQIIFTTYFKHVEANCIPAIKALQSSAAETIAAVKGFTPLYDEYKEDKGLQLAADLWQEVFAKDRFMARSFYRLRENLARILEEIAQMLPLLPKEPQEGNKRLGLQLIYRQRWIPEGYVRGKLVGYKNLPPDTEETIRRRTFVKTSREVSSLESFAATRQQDTARSMKESAEIASEMTEKGAISASTSGNFNFKVDANFGGSFGAQASTNYDLAKISRATNSLISETTFKASNAYNDKHEVKVVEQVQREDEFESTHTIRNLNKEITANYFYYQLFRQYLVTVELEDMRPVILRSKELPTEAEIDDAFLSTYAHVFAERLPAQLADNFTETIDEMSALARNLTDRMADADDREAAYTAFLSSVPRPKDTETPANNPAGTTDNTNPNAGDEWDRTKAEYEQMMFDAREEATLAEGQYLRARTKLDRVIAHVRRNRCYYAQYIWASDSLVDANRELETETFKVEDADKPLPELTRGLIREGYHGQEEIFTYNGPSLVLADLLAHNTIAGADIIASMSEEELRETTLFQQIKRYYTEAELDDAIEKIAAQAFPIDPTPEEQILDSRTVQVAQDALVVETMPGQVPLLEGFQLQKRGLSVELDRLRIEHEKLENAHLSGRIQDQTWKTGKDDRRVYRREGLEVPVEESEPQPQNP